MKALILFLAGLAASLCVALIGSVIFDHNTALYKTIMFTPAFYIGTYLMLFPLAIFNIKGWSDVKNLSSFRQLELGLLFTGGLLNNIFVLNLIVNGSFISLALLCISWSIMVVTAAVLAIRAIDDI